MSIIKEDLIIDVVVATDIGRVRHHYKSDISTNETRQNFVENPVTKDIIVEILGLVKVLAEN